MNFLTLNKLSSQIASWSFYFPGIITQHSISMPFTQSGPLRRMIIAAKFNETAQLGWPELQIIRRANNVTNGADTYVAFTTNATGPRTEPVYHNVYEYDLNSHDNFEVQIGDKLNISWHGDVQQPNQIRFSLAYYNNGILIPMASIFVGDCDPDPELNSLYCEAVTLPTANISTIYITKNVTSSPATNRPVISTDSDSSEANSMMVAKTIGISTTTNRPVINIGTESDSSEANSMMVAKTISISTTSRDTVTKESISTTVTQASTNQTNKSESDIKLQTDNVAVIISGVVVFSLFLLIMLLIFLVVFTFVVKRRRKAASRNVVGSTEMSGYTNQPRMLHNTPSRFSLITVMFI